MFGNFIFDWSGTLVDDLGPVLEATNVVLSKYGRPPLDRESFRRQFRLPYHEFYAEVLPDVSLPELEAHFRTAFDAAVSEVTVLPHTREQLDSCHKAGVRLFVLTSMDTVAFERQLDAFGLRSYFEATYSGVLDKRHMIHELISCHGLDPEQTAFVGDMTHDVETAQHGGVASIAVLSGYNHPEVLARVRPDITLPDVGGLTPFYVRERKAPLPIATVGGLIQNSEGEILMIQTHKWSNRWGIPGGKIERGESSEDALRREVREETALDIDEIKFLMVQDCIHSPEFYKSEHFLLLNYLAQCRAGEVRLNHEAEAYRWVLPQNALALDLNEPTRVLLNHFIQQFPS